MKRFLVLLLAISLIFTFTACNSGSGSGNGQAKGYVGDPSDEYYMVTFLSGIDYWKYCFEGFEDAAKAIGVTAKYTGQTDTDVSGQVAVLEQVIAQKPKGIAVTAVNSTALADTINSAISFCIGAVLFVSTAFADVVSKTGYEQFKDAIKNTVGSLAEEYDSFTTETGLSVKDNDRILAANYAIEKYDMVNSRREEVSTSEWEELRQAIIIPTGISGAIYIASMKIPIMSTSMKPR